MDDGDLIGDILVSEEDLRRRVSELAAEVSSDYEGRPPLLVAILKGAVPFLADLMRELTVPCELDFMAVSSYGSSTDSSGVVRILKDLEAPIEGRDVLIVEDIIDSGSRTASPSATGSTTRSASATSRTWQHCGKTRMRASCTLVPSPR